MTIPESGETAYVTGAELEKLAEPVTVYNLEVADFNTYFVGDNAVLVHNYPGSDGDANSWNEYQRNHSGEGKSSTELAMEYNASKPNKASTSSGKIHGNSLDYEGVNYGYVLKDKTTGEILKYGESINPSGRYTQSYLDENNAVMTILTQGSKRDIHQWQIDFNNIYKQFTGMLPRLTVYGN